MATPNITGIATNMRSKILANLNNITPVVGKICGKGGEQPRGSGSPPSLLQFGYWPYSFRPTR